VKFVYGALLLWAILGVFTAINLGFKEVRVQTVYRTPDPGPPSQSVPSEQLNPELKGMTCQIWQTEELIIRCK
jgi:hypothetical protein